MTQQVAWILQDSAVLALQLQRSLQALGYEVKQSECSVLILPIIPQPALVCVELYSITSNGFTILRQLAQSYTGPRILISGSGHSTDVSWGLRAGATAVLLRPFTQDQLAACIGCTV